MMDSSGGLPESSGNLIKVELPLNFLYPGIILQGDAYTSSGAKVWDGSSPMSADIINSLLKQKVQKIYYNKPKLRAGKVPVSNPMIDSETLEDAFDITQELGKAVIEKAIIPEKSITKVIENFIESIGKSQGMTLNLMELKDYDNYTYVHSINVCLVSILFAKKLSYNEKGLKTVGIAGLLHDLGKLMIPVEILNKVDPLTTDEFEIIKKHPVYSYELVRAQSSFGKLIEKVVLLHHEKYSGKGYPLGIRGEQIGEVAQIISIADVFDAITSDRSYKYARPYWFALSEIKKDSGKSFLPRLAQTFVQDMPKHLTEDAIFPIGSFVLLNTGEIGEVVNYEYPQTLKPVVNILINGRKEVVRYPIPINLQFDDTRFIENVFESTETINKLIAIKEKINGKGFSKI